MLFEKKTAIVLSALNFRPCVFPHAESLSRIVCNLCMVVLVLYPDAISIRSSAYPVPVVLSLLIISIAGLNAIFQKSADTTPPCGKPMLVVASYVSPFSSVCRSLCVK